MSDHSGSVAALRAELAEGLAQLSSAGSLTPKRREDGEQQALVALAALGRARGLLDQLIDEVSADGVLAGLSVRAVAQAAGVAPNTLPPRLARTSTLGGYSAAGKVDSEGIARARYDSRTGQHQRGDVAEPLRFRARRKG